MPQIKQPVFLSGSGNYTFLHYPNGSRELSSFTLKKMLLRYPALIRVHKSFAVNPECVQHWNLHAKRTSTVILIVAGKTHELTVSRQWARTIKKSTMADLTASIGLQ